MECDNYVKSSKFPIIKIEKKSGLMLLYVFIQYIIKL